MIQIAATLYALACLGAILFQFALIAGAPWGRYTQGGQDEGPLPRSARIAAGASVLLLAAMGAAILAAGGIFAGWPIWTAWAALTVQIVSTLLNLITPSQPERKLWGPITSIMLCLAVFVVFFNG